MILFVVALGYNVWGLSHHFTMGFMAGHEFRQSQTALIARYIDQENNFGLLYEVPVLGKPWVALLLEVPVYQWSVVGLSRLTGWEHVVAARAVSVTCFYVMLGGVWLLLGRLGVPRLKRLVFLGLILATPVYVFYSRAFLMDAMALMGSVWWLYAFVRVMQERDWRWLAVAVVAGSLSALIKGAVYAVWLVPGAAYGAWVLWGEYRAKLGWKRLVQTVCWGLGTVVVALGLLKLWLDYTDPIKAAHASAWIFTSKNLSLGNWGMFSAEALLSGTVWRHFLQCWEQAIMSRWLLGGVLLAGLFLRSVRGPVLGIGGMFFVAQFMMPYAFAYQDYYYYICAVFAVVAAGYVVTGLLERPQTAWAGLALWVVLFAAQVQAYRLDYYRQQSAVMDGGSPVTAALRELTPKNSVIVVAGADWAAMTPLYAERRALMVRNGLENDRDYLRRAFYELGDEEVSAVVLVGAVRDNQNLIRLVTERFELTPDPLFWWRNEAVYVSHHQAMRMRATLNGERWATLGLQVNEELDIPGPVRTPVSQELIQGGQHLLVPVPFEGYFEHGSGWVEHEGRKVLLMNPNADLWLRPPSGARRIEWRVGIMPGAYAREDAHTDGVRFVVMAEAEDGASRVLCQRVLEPWGRAEDRGEALLAAEYEPRPGETLRFCVRPWGNAAYDWSYTASIKVE
ncbi:MAG: glycosyltransferase family 39 protein [Opitutaceae bacterium]|nr:glycosyltransferase family 39 protein [Opitutaceae bacterium]